MNGYIFGVPDRTVNDTGLYWNASLIWNLDYNIYLEWED